MKSAFLSETCFTEIPEIDNRAVMYQFNSGAEEKHFEPKSQEIISLRIENGYKCPVFQEWALIPLLIPVVWFFYFMFLSDNNYGVNVRKPDQYIPEMWKISTIAEKTIARHRISDSGISTLRWICR